MTPIRPTKSAGPGSARYFKHYAIKHRQVRPGPQEGAHGFHNLFCAGRFGRGWASMTLTPAQLILGSQVNGFPKAYVIGSYDTRITFYSQQVRALALAHALHAEHHIGANARIGIIGGGAAGVAMAAALALQSDAAIQLFEQASELMPLQSAATRRRLDPHIYDWPRSDAEHAFAELPILDWASGSARAVREAVLGEFEAVRNATDQQIALRLRQKISAVTPVGAGYRIDFERDAIGGREPAQTEVDIIVFAFGFGREPTRPIQQTPTESYWTDGGVPGPGIDGKALPVFFVSGNGDGGLIDFVAAASAVFDHDAMIRTIAHRQGVMALAPELLAIDAEARLAEAAGNGFDFVSAYDARINAQIAALGLINEVSERLRPGVQLVLQTREPDLMSIRTATLNRLAAYLVIKACALDNEKSFRHIVCATVNPVDPPVASNAPPFLFDCDGTEVPADAVIARRGPDRDTVRAPFAAMLDPFEAQHGLWVEQFPEDSIAPVLSDEARAHFDRLARDKHLPPPRYRHDALVQNLPLRIKIAQHGAQARWTGDVSLGEATLVWGRTARALKMLVEATPDPLGPLAFAIARLGLHCRQPLFELDVPNWQPFLSKLTCNSQHAADLALPTIHARSADASILNAAEHPPADMAALLHQAMDRWILDAVAAHLDAYLAQGDNPGRLVPFSAATDLGAVMAGIWAEWRVAFEGDSALLARFLQLSLCAQDRADLADEARCLVGPLMLKRLIGTIAVTLAIASVWPVMTPHGAQPGNLARTAGEAVRLGHACAAELIEGELMPIRASSFMWQTHFVVLPMVNIPSGFSVMADASLLTTDQAVPRLTEPSAGSNLVLTVDGAFVNAAGAGIAALTALLGDTEALHFVRLAKGIEKAEELVA